MSMFITLTKVFHNIDTGQNLMFHSVHAHTQISGYASMKWEKNLCHNNKVD